MALSPAEKQSAYRRRQAAKSIKPLNLNAHIDDHAAIQAYAEKLAKARNK